jgi:uncharacterized protein YciI
MNRSLITSITLLATFILFASCTFKQGENLTSRDQPSGYDAALAQKIGADDYGMRKYVMAFLQAGPNRSQDADTRAKLQRAHLDNITRLANQGKLILAGPFLDNGEIRGIYIFDVQTVDEARKLTETDPAIQAGSLKMDLHPWYGSAALMQVNEIHQKIAKLKI